VLTGLTPLLFPCGFHSATRPAILQSCIHMMWPHHFNCCYSISCNMSLFIPIFCCNCFISNSIHSWNPCRTPQPTSVWFSELLGFWTLSIIRYFIT
jgi:hypothetical protein